MYSGFPPGSSSDPRHRLKVPFLSIMILPKKPSFTVTSKSFLGKNKLNFIVNIFFLLFMGVLDYYC